MLLLGLYRKRYDISVFVLLFGLVSTGTRQINQTVERLVTGAFGGLQYINQFAAYLFEAQKRSTKPCSFVLQFYPPLCMWR